MYFAHSCRDSVFGDASAKILHPPRPLPWQLALVGRVLIFPTIQKIMSVERSSELSTAPRSAYDFLTFDSWSDADFLVRCGLSPEAVFEELEGELAASWERLEFSIYGRTVPLPRLKVFVGDEDEDGFFPFYRYGGDYVPVVRPWTPLLKAIRDAIEVEFGLRCNHLVVARFADGGEYIGPHHDKVRDFMPGTSIVTVSLGQPRLMRLNEVDGEKRVIERVVVPGSAYRLGWDTNLAWKHSIPKRSPCTVPGPRISLTFREMKTWRHPETGELKEKLR